MMKKILVFLSLLIFLFSFSISAFAKDNDNLEVSSELAQKVNYELPYPGLLPDHPLYILRIIRDRIVDFLISDPLKKAEFNLLQADKRLNAGIYLFNKGKISMSISTISKAENYFEKAIQKIKEAKGQGRETSEIINKVINSGKKHKEVLKSLEEKAPEDFKSSFNLQLKRADKFAQEAIGLRLK